METWLLIVIIAASVLVVGALVWFLFLRKSEEEAEAVTQVVDLSEGKLALAVGEVAYGTLTVDAVEGASVLVGACDVVELSPAEEGDLPAAEEEGEGEAEEEEERRLREEDEEEEAATETFYYMIEGKEEGECELLMVYTAAEDVDLEDEETWPDAEDMQATTVAVTVSAGEGEGAEEAEEEEEEEE